MCTSSFSVGATEKDDTSLLANASPLASKRSNATACDAAPS
jgi:hypothetical protein